MPLTPRRKDSTPPLSPELRTLLLYGPDAVGKALADVDHDTLRALWQVHGPALLASKGCPKKPWFVERDWFVTFVRRELL